MSVADWHEKLFVEALATHERNPEFRFAMRMRDAGKSERMSRGYWFTGNDDYLFMGLFRPNDPKNKTRTVGYCVGFDDLGKPIRCYLSVVYKGITDPALRSVHESLVGGLGHFKVKAADNYKHYYLAPEPVVSFREFLARDYPRMREILRSAGAERDFLISPNEFRDMLDRITPLRGRTGGAV
jgi:hypothetical protein